MLKSLRKLNPGVGKVRAEFQNVAHMCAQLAKVACRNWEFPNSGAPRARAEFRKSCGILDPRPDRNPAVFFSIAVPPLF